MAQVLVVRQGKDGNDSTTVALLKRAGGVGITGGEQAGLVSRLSGTQVMERERVSHCHGVSAFAGKAAKRHYPRDDQ